MKGLLIHLINDLIQDRDLRFHFNRDPEEVMDAYHLSTLARQCLQTMDRDKVLALMVTEFESAFDRWGFPDDGFPVGKKNRPTSGVGPHYPSPEPDLFQLSKDTIPSGGNGKQRTLRAFGQSWTRTTEATVTAPNGTVVAIKQAVRGSFRSPRIVIRVPSGLTPGTYVVSVKVNPGGGMYEVPIPQTLEFEIV